MGRDERVGREGYAEQDPEAVARQLEDAAALFANVVARPDDAGLARTVMYKYPGPAPTERSLSWVAVHTLHEVTHHRRDIADQL